MRFPSYGRIFSPHGTLIFPFGEFKYYLAKHDKFDLILKISTIYIHTGYRILNLVMEVEKTLDVIYELTAYMLSSPAKICIFSQ